MDVITSDIALPVFVVKHSAVRQKSCPFPPLMIKLVSVLATVSDMLLVGDFSRRVVLAALLLRNLDSGTEETKIIQALLNVIPTSGIRNAKIMRDPRSQQSVGFGFVQFKTQHDCTEMYNCLMRINPPLTIDGKQGTITRCQIFLFGYVIACLAAISFAKQPLNEIIAPPPHQTPFPNSSYNQTPSAPPRTGYGQGKSLSKQLWTGVPMVSTVAVDRRQSSDSAYCSC